MYACVCIYTGYGLSADAYHGTSPSPTGEGAILSMRSALADAQKQVFKFFLCLYLKLFLYLDLINPGFFMFWVFFFVYEECSCRCLFLTS